jgi:hypothetical protein
MSFASFDLVDFNETFIYFLLVLDAIFIVTSCLAFEGGVSIRANTTTVSLSVMSQPYRVGVTFVRFSLSTLYTPPLYYNS